MSIEVQHLTKIYGTQKAVGDISFTVNKGEIVGFLGPNGAGKSTTMKMITGYLAADNGIALVSGINTALQPLEAKKKVGYLPESNALYYDMYVREYLDFVAGIYQVADLKNQIEACIEKVGLIPEANKKIGQLSKGYKQRVGLAAALIHNPEVLILDEPTSGLDPNQIVEIRELIRELGKEKTVLFSSHIMQEVQAICDRVIIINKGSIVADDTLGKLQQGKTNALVVSFAESLQATTFGAISGTTSIGKITDTQWQLAGNDIAAIRKQVMQLALDKNLNILSMQEGGGTLEEIFRQLTT
ncbi:MAG: gliding motility-associated ABC transporter ATP-binding subunit GldA [Chitinophagaceae bacterium]